MHLDISLRKHPFLLALRRWGRFAGYLDMVPRSSTPGGFAYIWQSKWVGIISIKTERTQIHFLSDVLIAFASLDRGRYTRGILLPEHAQGAKLLRVYQRFHGYTSSSGAEFPPRKMLHDTEEGFCSGPCSRLILHVSVHTRERFQVRSICPGSLLPNI